MHDPLETEGSSLAPKLAAPQHKPRPLPLFLELLRRETIGDTELMRRALAGLRAYQEADRVPPRPLMPAIAESKGAVLRDYGGSGQPVLFVPSLINPPGVLDLGEGKSLLRWLAGRGHRVLLLDWGSEVEPRRDLSVTGHVERILLPLIAALGEPPLLVGYCLGGTMAVAAAHRARAVVTIAAPWHFAGFPEQARIMLAALWQGAGPTAASLGLMPMEVLQSAFWSLDPARTVRKFADFAAMEPGSPRAKAFVTLEDWANDGPPISEAAARQLFEEFFAADRPGSGKWQVDGQIVDPDRLPCPLLNIASTSDRIVPHATAIRAGERLDLAQGHVGMIVGTRARETLWAPLDAWLSALG